LLLGLKILENALSNATQCANGSIKLFGEQLSCYCTVGLTEYGSVEVLAKAFHAVRSIVCLATNETPRKRLFRSSRKATNVSTLPT